MTSIHRGDIWLVNLDPKAGAEIKKTRPAMIISNDIANQCASTVTILPVSDRGEMVHPFETEIPARAGGLTKPSKVKAQQIRTVDKQRLVRFMGVVTERTVFEVEKALCLHLAIDTTIHR